jgi:hypothetical protein
MDGSLTIDRLSRSLIELLGTIHTLEACGLTVAENARWLGDRFSRSACGGEA